LSRIVPVNPYKRKASNYNPCAADWPHGWRLVWPRRAWPLRVSGRPAARDPQRPQYRVYSADELRAALVELAGRSPRPAPPPPPPLDPLPLLWQAAAQRLALPSNRLLLLHQGRLIALRERGRLVVAVIAAAPQWLPLIESRRGVIARALADTLARPVALELREVAP
jgi:hypothetical protein